MVSVCYCCCSADAVNRETVQLPSSCLTQPVSAARAAAAQVLGLSPNDIELVFRGRPLLDDRPMASYELSSSSVVHAFRRPPGSDTASAPVAPASPEPADGTQLAWTLQQHTQDPARRHAFTQRLGRPEVLERLLAAVPGLEDDPIAVGLLQEPGLLLQVASPRTNVKKLVARHPVLAAAASQLAALLGEGSSGTERGRPGPSGSRAAARAMDERAMEQGSFDDDDGDEDPGAGGGPAPPITRAQLASALAAAVPSLTGAQPAAAGRPAAAAGPSTAPAAAPAPAPPGMISPEMVSAALREAMRVLPGTQRPSPAAPAAQQPPPAPAAPPPAPDAAAPRPAVVDEAAVRQLLELGITDSEALVRQALQVSEGNIDHAVEFIYATMQ